MRLENDYIVWASALVGEERLQTLRAQRQRCGFQWSISRCWVALDHNAVTEVLTSPLVSSRPYFADSVNVKEHSPLAQFVRSLEWWTPLTEGDGHRRQRVVLRDVVRWLADRAHRELSGELYGVTRAALERPECNVVQEIVEPLSSRLAGALLGLKQDEIRELGRLGGLLDELRSDNRSELRVRAFPECVEPWLRDLERMKGILAASELLAPPWRSRIYSVCDGHKDLAEGTAIMVTTGILEPLRNAIGIVVAAGLKEPWATLDQLTVESCLAAAPPVEMVARVVAHNGDLCRKRVLRGQGVIASVTSANQSLFDNPRVSDTELFPFGRGIHRCVGAPLALVALEPVLRAVRDWRRVDRGTSIVEGPTYESTGWRQEVRGLTVRKPSQDRKRRR